ncbi:MAG: hypothetical protein NTW25_12705 [Candidatus Kapabacteria bacterium]|jgi:hypothetical protein|nr:hypothetical protein [Candidatus Kapabacteria bacterium]
MNNFWFPGNSVITENANGSISIQPSSDWSYVGYDKSGALINSSGSSNLTQISCTCTASSGYCNVVYNPSDKSGGCGGICTKCIMDQKLTGLNIDMGNGGYINMSIQPYLITAGEVVPQCFKAMFDVPQINTIFNNYMNYLFNGATIPALTVDTTTNLINAPSGCLLGLLNIVGRAVLIPVPLGLASPANSGTHADCNCSATGACTYKEISRGPFSDPLITCEDGCNGTCTMVLKNINPVSNQVCIKVKSPTFIY